MTEPKYSEMEVSAVTGREPELFDGDSVWKCPADDCHGHDEDEEDDTEGSE